MTSMASERASDVTRVRLRGARFERGRLPVDSLVELEKYQEIIRVAATAEWRKAHGGKEPPTDFQSSVSLTIERIDEGSADVYLAFEQQAVYAEYQAQARDSADATIVAAYSDAPLPELPYLTEAEEQELRGGIAQLGKTLQPDQSIEYYPDGPDSTPITITVATRKEAADRLFGIENFLISDDETTEASELTTRIESLVGRVTVIDADKQHFTLELPDGGSVGGLYKNNPGLLEDLRAVVNSTARGPLTRISGKLQSKNGAPWRFKESTEVQQVEFDDTPWGRRLTEFAQLRPGWDGGGASQISSPALDAAQQLLRAVDSAEVERPGVYPTEEGGILVEWADAAAVRNVEILVEGGYELFAMKRDQSHGEQTTTGDLTVAVDFAKASLT